MIGVAGAVFGYLRTQTLKAELCPSTFLLLPCLAAAGQDSLEPRVHLLSLAVCAPSTLVCVHVRGIEDTTTGSFGVLTGKGPAA